MLVVLYKYIMLSNNMQENAMTVAKRQNTLASKATAAVAKAPKARRKPAIPPGGWENPRRASVLETAKREGLMTGTSSRIAARIRKPLIEAAKARSGITSDTELLEYALACVAIEDDFGKKLIARTGSVPKDIDLEF
jgi:hypothetical protein